MATVDHSAQGGLGFAGSADVAFTGGAGQVDADVVVEWDFDNDGDFADAVEDITSYVMSLETLTGRDHRADLGAGTTPGALRVSVLNTDDRFSYFNADSPLNADGNSLRTGRKVRVRTSDAVVDDPVLLARDRFNAADGPLSTTETGQAWTAQLNGGFTVEDGEAVYAGTSTSANTVATVDVDTDDHYVQATVPRVEPGIIAGVVLLWADSSNYWRVYVNASNRQLIVASTIAGSATLVEAVDITLWEGMTIGAGIDGDTLTAYVAGVPVYSTTGVTGTGTSAGIYGFATSTANRVPALDNFHVWDRVAAAAEGVLFTGYVSDVNDTVPVGAPKITTVTCDGVLARAATAVVEAPRVPLSGAPTGQVVGDIMARAGLLHPPYPLDEGTVTTGPIGIPDGDALGMARLLEETERGFLYETAEGPPGFLDRAARTDTATAAWFTDTPGAGQYAFTEITPLDHKRQVVNRVTAGVAPSEPDGISLTVQSSDAAILATNHTDIVMPTVNHGDLVVVFVARANQTSDVDWITPIWWFNHRDDELDAIRTRVYSRWCNGTESGETYRFYHDSGPAGGGWVAHIYRIQDWFNGNGGVAMTEFASGRTANPLDHGWGRVSALYLAAYGAMTTGGSADEGDTTYPDGYASGTTTSLTTNGAVLLSTAQKVDVTEGETPTAFAGDEGFLITESTVFAVRGYNGPHTKATLQNPRTTGGLGRTVTVEDVDSQDDHNQILSHKLASNLFATEDDATAYGGSILAEYADDRPVVSLSFVATSSANLRAQAVRRRVGDRVHVTASGATGLGVDDDFTIESIGHRISHAGKQWRTTWEMAPA